MANSIQGNQGFSDHRARLSAKPAARTEIYGEPSTQNILEPIRQSGGLMWPYTPIITDNASVQYDSYDPVHSNQPYMAFKSVAPKEIMCSGQFTAMNQEEGRYCVATMHFLRTITKMYFGVGGTDSKGKDLRGTPPPVLIFNAHGTSMFHNVPVVVTSYSIELPQDVDYIQIGDDSGVLYKARFDESVDNTIYRADGPERIVDKFGRDGATAWVPTRFNVTVNMTVQNTPDRWRRHFNLNDFRTGKLIKNGGWV